MRIHRLQTIQRLPITLDEAWAFFSSPKNLRQITPHWLDFRMTNEAPEEMHPGTILSYTVRPFPLIPVQWVTEITHIEKPYFFVDEQRFGPFKLWHHEHYFRPHPGGVEVEDIVQYGLFFGPLGTLVHDLVVRKRLHDIFTYRAQVLEQRFGRVESSATPAPAAARQAGPRTQSPKTAPIPNLQHPSLQNTPAQQPNPQRPRPKPPQPSQTPQQPPPAQQPPPKTSPKTPPPPGTITLEDIYKDYE